MGLIQKRDEEENELLGDIDIIESGDVPGEEEHHKVDLVTDESAEDIAAKGRHERGEDVPDPDDVPLNPFEDHKKRKGRQGKADKAKDRKEPAAPEAPAGSDGGTTDGPVAPQPARKNVIAVAAAVIALVVGLVCGYAFGSDMLGGAKGVDASTITEDELDDTVASFTYKGETRNITAREAIESEYSLDTVKNDDGTYATPAADTVLTYARNQVMLAEAESRGIEVSDDEMTSYAESMLGTSDYSELATTYGVSEDQAKEIVRQNTMINKLREQVVPEYSSTTAPTQPTAPEDGNTDTASKDYADYIINLAGDEWDAEAGTWASADGTIAQALSGETFTADSATYAQAMKAYYAVYEQYVSTMTDAQSAWREFGNSLFAQADLTLYGLFA